MKKILVAEDDNFLANAYRVKLTKSGYDVQVVGDGQGVFDILATSFRPDLIILDLMMPNVDGFAVLAKIMADTNWQNTPCIVASNLGQKEDIEKATQLGAKDYIVKTDLSMRELIAKIKSLIGE